MIEGITVVELRSGPPSAAEWVDSNRVGSTTS